MPNGEQVIWLFLATEDIRIKRDRNRNEIAGKAVLDSIFFVPEDQRPRHFAFRSLPRDGVIGGDFVWAQSFPDNDDPKLECVVLGDGVGHGVEAALQAVQAGVSLRRLMSEDAIGQKHSWRHQENPAKALLQALGEDFAAASRRAADSVARRRASVATAGALDACALVLDHKAGKIFVAGTNMPVWMMPLRKRNEPDPEQIVKFDSGIGVKHIGLVVDMRGDAVSPESFQRGLPQKRRLRFILSTDGLVEQRSKKTVDKGSFQFSSSAIESAAKRKSRDSVDDTLDAIIDDWQTHRNGAEQDDDALIAAIDVNPN